jgi:hypothetical protein
MKRKKPKYGIHGMPMIIKWIRERKEKENKCAEKTLNAYRTHANKNLKKIEKVLDLS